MSSSVASRNHLMMRSDKCWQRIILFRVSKLKEGTSGSTDRWWTGSFRLHLIDEFNHRIFKININKLMMMNTLKSLIVLCIFFIGSLTGFKDDLRYSPDGHISLRLSEPNVRIPEMLEVIQQADPFKICLFSTGDR